MVNRCLAALALAATMIVSGCGGSSKTASSSTPAASTPATSVSTTTPANVTVPNVAPVTIASGTPLSKAEWIARGDVICAQLNAQLNTLKVHSTTELAHVLPRAALYERAALYRLTKIVAPTLKRSVWQTLVTDVQRLSEYSAKLGESGGKTLLTLPLFKSLRAVHEGFARRAKHEGFKQCSVI